MYSYPEKCVYFHTCGIDKGNTLESLHITEYRWFWEGLGFAQPTIHFLTLLYRHRKAYQYVMLIMSV